MTVTNDAFALDEVAADLDHIRNLVDRAGIPGKNVALGQVRRHDTAFVARWETPGP